MLSVENQSPARDRVIPVLNDLFERRPEIAVCQESILKAYTLLENSLQSGGKVLVCGNGGSASDANHIVAELMKGFEHPRPVPRHFVKKMSEEFGEIGQWVASKLQVPLRAVSLCGSDALATAIANDTSAEMVFAQQLYGSAQPGDVFLGISTSGNSKNVLNALIVAKSLGLSTIVLTGPAGGKISELADCSIRAPGRDTPTIQESHLPIYHALCLMLETHFFPEI